MDEIKKAMESFFDKQKTMSQKRLGTNPSVPYSESLNKRLLISQPDDDGEVEWKPSLQPTFTKWKEIEDILGFILCDELKAYYSSYFFLDLSGKFGSAFLYFQPIYSEDNLKGIIIQQYKDGQYIFPKSQVFLIGNAVIDDDDGYFIFYDNSSSKTFCHETDSNRQVLLTYSLAKVINSIEAIL